MTVIKCIISNPTVIHIIGVETFGFALQNATIGRQTLIVPLMRCVRMLIRDLRSTVNFGCGGVVQW